MGHFVLLAALSVWGLWSFGGPTFKGFYNALCTQFPGSNAIPAFPSDIEIGTCVDWKKGEDVHPTVTILLDGDADLFFAGEGGLSQGVFNVSKVTRSSPPGMSDDDNKVKVTATGHGDWEKIKVCKITRGTSTGVGVFSPSQLSLGGVDISVQLPVRKPGSREISLGTYLPAHSHQFEDLKEIVFNEVSILAAREALQAKFIEAKTFEIQTNGAIIQGNYKSTRSATFSNTVGQIQVDLELVNKVGATDPTNAKFTTTTGRVDLHLDLTRGDAGDASATGGTFIIDMASSRGELNAFFRRQPLDSRLFFTAETLFRKINVGLKAAFQGRYVVSNPWSSARTHFAPDVKDPTGRNRLRHGQGQGSRWEESGAIWWSEDMKDAGHVSLKSFLASVIDLYFYQ